ncbi:MAG: metalloprotease TldD [Betaproteobacteria bacterium]|nr:metalloprotease TldD [Betaproteobacteria bacterium]
MSATPLSVAQSVLLAPYGLTESSIESVFGEILTHDADYADLFFQYSRTEGWSLEEGRVKSGSFNIDQGVGVRVVAGEKTAFAYSDDISREALSSAAAATRGIARAGGNGSAGKSNKTVAKAGHSLYTFNDPVSSFSDADKVRILERLEQFARAIDPRVKEVMGRLSGEYDVVMVARHDGTLAADVRPLVHIGLTVIAEQNGRREQGGTGGGGRYDYTYFSDDVLREIAHQAVREALINLDAKPAPAGQMAVVLGSGWPGILLHEAVGHSLEGDFNRKGSSVFSGRVGERIAARGVTVIDDGTIADRRGSLNIDDEGNLTQRNVLIEDGILKGYMQDSMNARLMNVPVTGNARRESYAHIPMPRMTNTLMLGGEKSPEEIIASVKHGLYAANFGGGQVDTTSGKFVFSASEAYMIENGKIAYPVVGATLIGNGIESLKQVSMIGNDMQLDSGIGVCGKEGQSVPVGVGQPTLRIEGLTVGGTG